MNAGDMSSSSVASRFVSEAQLTEAQKKREEDIRAAYARMGQSPPPEALQNQEEYDPRTLYDKLKANTDAKQEIFEEKMKLSNQFRGIDDAESQFLAEVAKEKMEEQTRREEETLRELEGFRKAALAKEGSPPGPKTELKSEMSSKKAVTNPAKSKGKRKREGLLGVVKKKPAVESIPTNGQAKDASSKKPDGVKSDS